MIGIGPSCQQPMELRHGQVPVMTWQLAATSWGLEARMMAATATTLTTARVWTWTRRRQAKTRVRHCPLSPGGSGVRGSFGTRNGSITLALASEHIPYTPEYALACHWNDPLRSIRGVLLPHSTALSSRLTFLAPDRPNTRGSYTRGRLAVRSSTL